MSVIWTQAEIDEKQEQVRMIRDSAASMVEQHGGLKRIRNLRYSDTGMGRDVWRDICNAGLTGLRVAEDKGGIGLGMIEYVALQEELGKGLMPEPLLEAGLVAELLDGEESEAQIAGERLILPAGIGSSSILPRLQEARLYGEVGGVMLARAADAYLVATDDGNLVLVDAQSEGLTLEVELLQDGSHLANLHFDGTPVSRQLRGQGTTAAVEAATLGLAAYLVGVMQGAFDMTLDFLKVRKQFGREIGSFQSLQHRVVDMKIHLELARNMVQATACEIDQRHPAERLARSVSTARVKASTAALQVTRESIQMHGGIGYTDEADIGLYLRKVMTLLNRFGSVDEHKRRYTDLITSQA
ncbi:acyl-CoA dehydrogenase [Vreelandella aquamarina]|uniref:Acyl-CoA dehydrogenase n=1 Tax=Vreelandella aquamarina TaxID=77097 RepID=A0A6F8XGG8_9GAMM|nr:acyl-CoA dehydrogenase family protein [Halomonas meridiana]BCB72593.1 acyl-CoA dehydrogenase [Halomonas meridiana]